MENRERKSVNYYMRKLHRDVGFFVIGLTIIFTLSGVVLIFRDTDFFKKEAVVERELEPNLESDELGQVLRIKDFKVIRTEGDLIVFKNGEYNKASGVVIYTVKELPLVFKKLTNLHKSSSKSLAHWGTIIYGGLLLFLAISALWMFKVTTKQFRRGIYFVLSGFLLAIILLFL
jgi:hypothetical protein